MEPREAAGKETMGSKRKNLTFLRSKLYMLERRKTDTVVDSGVSGDHSGSLRRSQSDRTEYNQKLQGKPKRKQATPGGFSVQLRFWLAPMCRDI